MVRVPGDDLGHTFCFPEMFLCRSGSSRCVGEGLLHTGPGGNECRHHGLVIFSMCGMFTA